MNRYKFHLTSTNNMTQGDGTKTKIEIEKSLNDDTQALKFAREVNSTIFYGQTMIMTKLEVLAHVSDDGIYHWVKLE